MFQRLLNILYVFISFMFFKRFCKLFFKGPQNNISMFCKDTICFVFKGTP